ncbi:protein kinase domain-containing protein [Xanthobacter sp. AM11]|uniref:serine/threonine-protein kinase n=1 Tax=Xanthobacter sp. AM11 TaxID=3380643 RepID=UPI0039BF0E09
MVTRPGETTGTWLPRGTRLNDLFEIDEGIAAGGMGEIYRGHAIETGDLVAIKTIRSDVAETDAALTMFRKEAKALHNLYHEAIVRYYVFSVDPTLKRPYLAMEYVSGPSLSAMVRNGALDYDSVRVLGARVAAGLQAAHERGIIHRDISPDNVIIPDADVAQAKIIDFGIARQTRAAEGTIVGDGFAGKYNYVSPEQLGLFGADVTGASDIYSLGLVLVEAITGEPLDMRGSPVEVIEKRRRVPDLSRVDKRLRPLLERMLQPDPRDRPGSMTEVAAWLRRGGTAPPATGRHPFAASAEGTVVSARPHVRMPDRRGRDMRPWLRAAIGSGLVVAVLAGLGGGAYWLLSGPGSPSSPAPRPEAARPAAPADGRLPEAGAVPGTPARPAGTGGLTLTRILPDSIAPARPADMTRFLDRYALAECAFLDPVVMADARAAGDGFGRARSDFGAIAADFERAHGFSLDVRLRQVTTAQCPVIDLLAQGREERAQAPQLEVVSHAVHPGGVVEGEAMPARGRYVSVAAVFASGAVRVVAGAARPAEGEAVSFRFTVDPQVAPAGTPLLLVAVSSAQALAPLRTDAAMGADVFVAQLKARAGGSGDRLAFATRYVTVE